MYTVIYLLVVLKLTSVNAKRIGIATSALNCIKKAIVSIGGIIIRSNLVASLI